MATRAPQFLRPILHRLEEISRSTGSDESPLTYLEDLVAEYRNPGAALAEIFARGPSQIVRDTARGLLFVACKNPTVPAPVRKKLLASARPVLLGALRDPAVSDDAKHAVGPIYSLAGGDLDAIDYEGCFQDFAATSRRLTREHMDHMQDSVATVESCLEATGIICHDAPPKVDKETLEQAFVLGAEFMQHAPTIGASLLGTTLAIALEHGRVRAIDRFVAPVIEGLARMGSGRSLWILRALSALPFSEENSERMIAAERDLESRGLRPEPPRVPAFSHGLVSGPDGAGNRQLALFFRTDDGALDAVVALLCDQVGVKDVWILQGNGADLDVELREATGDSVTYAPCTVELAHELFCDAYAVHAALGTVPPGRLVLYAAYLGAAPLEARRRVPRLGAYALETHVRSAALVDGSEALARHPAYRERWFSSDEAYAFVASQPGRGRSLSSRAQIPERTIDAFLSAIAAVESPLLAARLASTLEIAALAGRARAPENAMAARLWLALAESVVPFAAIPYVRQLARLALPRIAMNLDMGYKSQRQANRASLEVEDVAGMWG